MLDNLNKFLTSPQGMAMAAGLLSSSGPSLTPISNGQALGKGMLNMQQASQQDMENKFKQAQLQNMQQEMAMRQIQINNEKAKASAWQKFVNGSPSNSNMNNLQQATVPAYNDSSYKAPANSIDNSQLFSDITLPSKSQAPINNSSQPVNGVDPQTQQLVALAVASGDYKTASELLQQKNKFSKPEPGVDTQGKPVYFQVDGYGNPKKIEGFAPPPKSQMGLTIDPSTGAMTFMQGTGVMPNGFIKDPMMGPSRGGQGGTYINPKTGEIVSTNTNSRTTTDQTTVAAVERIQPQLKEIGDKMAPFLTSQKQLRTWFEGVGNQSLGTNFQGPSIQASGKAAINISAEGLMKTLQLPSTNEALDLVKTAITPVPGESPQGYKDRMNHEMQNIVMMSNQAKNRLAKGIVVQEPTQVDSGALSQMAQDAIKQGADPIQVQARLNQLQGGR